LKEKLKTDADEAEKNFPKAAQSARDLADKIGEVRMPSLAQQATGQMLAGNGEKSFQSADRLRSEMEKLFGECQGGNCPNPGELDNYLKLQRGMKPGNNFAQMGRSKKPGLGKGQNPGFMPGQGTSGSSGYAVQDGSKVDVMGNEFKPSHNSATAKQTARAGKGQGTLAAAPGASDTDKPDAVKGLNPVNRQSGAVASETLVEEYNDVVENYFKAITTKKKP